MSVNLMGILVLLLVGVALVAVPVAIVIGVSIASRRSQDLTPNPNLAPCPDCQKLISIHAPSCPHCGRTFKGA